MKKAFQLTGTVYRYWAITDPFNYPTKMSDKRAAYLIIIVWICSSSISFPAIAWWRLTANGKIFQLLRWPIGRVCKFNLKGKEDKETPCIFDP